MIDMPEFAAWRFVDGVDGFEVVYPAPGRLRGHTSAVEDGTPYAVRYEIELDARWHTRRARVWADTPDRTGETVLTSDGDGRWTLDGAPAPHLDGLIDVDLEASACTNTLPIHRMTFPVGEVVHAAAVYVRALGPLGHAAGAVLPADRRPPLRLHRGAGLRGRAGVRRRGVDRRLPGRRPAFHLTHGPALARSRPRKQPGPMTYPNTSLFIDDDWVDAADERTIPVHNPATGQVIGSVAHASVPDLDRALAAAQRGFEVWRDHTPAKRSKIMRQAAALIRERRRRDRPPASRSSRASRSPRPRARRAAAADIIDWFADEGFRVYGRIVPHRAQPRDPADGHQGPRRARWPRSRPGTSRSTRSCAKSRAGLAAGCSMIVKAPEETPAAPGRVHPRLRGRGPARRRARAGLRRPGRDLGPPHPAPDDPQDHLHRVDRRSASSWPRWRAST